MKNLRFVMLAVAMILLVSSPIMAFSTVGTPTVVATEQSGGGESAPVDVDVSVESPAEAPAGEAGLFGLNSTLLIVIAVLIVALVIGMIARGGKN